ncbi:hypothetical protein BDW22DRAFT_458072 [Trametopsis cervina]|nr:hypothetical protein BDW22DRAFT_458072 [Trametopsis cervina]
MKREMRDRLHSRSSGRPDRVRSVPEKPTKQRPSRTEEFDHPDTLDSPYTPRLFPVKLPNQANRWPSAWRLSLAGPPTSCHSPPRCDSMALLSHRWLGPLLWQPPSLSCTHPLRHPSSIEMRLHEPYSPLRLVRAILARVPPPL